MSRFFSIALVMWLAACSANTITKQDVVGAFCGRAASPAGDRLDHHVLFLTKGGHYRYVVWPSGHKAEIDVTGAYEIYGSSPIERVNFQNICLQSGCGDYPAQVMKADEQVEIVLEDSGGKALSLERCGDKVGGLGSAVEAEKVKAR